MKLSLITIGISTGARAVVELQDPCRALMVDLSSANKIIHLCSIHSCILSMLHLRSSPYTNNVTAMVKVFGPRLRHRKGLWVSNLAQM